MKKKLRILMITIILTISTVFYPLYCVQAITIHNPAAKEMADIANKVLQLGVINGKYLKSDNVSFISIGHFMDILSSRS